MKLAACPKCHAQYDVADVLGETVTCPCGATFPATAPAAVDAAVTRCAACGALVGDEERICSYCQATVTREPAPTGPVCPECYARNPERALHCTACGVAFLPQPVRKTGELLECPICPGVQLAARSLGGLWVDECPMCLGLWAPGDVMDRLIDRVRERRRQEGPPPSDHIHRNRRSRWQARIAYRKCPVCSGAMQRKNFAGHSGVVVDWCGSHGTWLDTHEMEDIAASWSTSSNGSMTQGTRSSGGFRDTRTRSRTGRVLSCVRASPPSSSIKGGWPTCFNRARTS